MWGAVSSVADVAFEGVTGKSLEDTVLALVQGHDSDTRVASAKVAAPNIAVDTRCLRPTCRRCRPSMPASAAPDGLDLAAFSNALSAKGVNGDMAQRALYAYRRSMGAAGRSRFFASVN